MAISDGRPTDEERTVGNELWRVFESMLDDVYYKFEKIQEKHGLDEKDMEGLVSHFISPDIAEHYADSWLDA